jgi:hypothetical protein
MKTLIIGNALLVVGAISGWADPNPADRLLAERAAAIRPVAEEMRWQQIPWLTDLAAGQRLARSEQRPIFLWVTGDDPLERC